VFIQCGVFETQGVIDRSDFWQKDTPVLAGWLAEFPSALYYYTAYLNKTIKRLYTLLINLAYNYNNLTFCT
jgi:hypothetical protein